MLDKHEVPGSIPGWPTIETTEECPPGLFSLGVCKLVRHASWLLFAVLILAPDIGMIGYLRGTRIGAWSYNAFHSYVGPVIALAGTLAFSRALVPLALIWAAHIALDRALGYGLKYPDAFAHTHLGVLRGSKG